MSRWNGQGNTDATMILITGASGRIGRRTAELLEDCTHGLRLMSRNPDSVPRIAGAQVVCGDFADPSTLDPAFRGIEIAFVISASGKPGERALLHRNAFEAAVRAHVGHIVYLSLQGSGPDSRFPFSRDHYLSEQYLAASGIPFTVLRAAFYMDMFVGLFDASGVVRGPAEQGSGAFVSREDVARTAAAVMVSPPGGIYDVTGPEALGIADVAHRLSKLVECPLRYEEESADTMRRRLGMSGRPSWQVGLSVGWFEAIAAGEIERASEAVRRFTGNSPLTLEDYFTRFPALLEPLRLT